MRARWIEVEACLLELAEGQAGVISRRQLYAAGLTRGMVRAQLRARRWRAVGRHSVSVATGPLTPEAEHWAAVLEGGPRALLDGPSALVAAGLVHFTEERIRVSVPKGARIQQRRNGRVDLRETRRWRPDDAAAGSGVPRTRPAVAAVRAALWARSDRQAALLLMMPVQQGLCLVEELVAEFIRVRRDRRRTLIQAVLSDMAGGVRSLGEMDVVRGLRDRGIPVPDQQQVRKTRAGTYYLDFRWRRYAVVLEVDGVQHGWVRSVVGDALRHNSIAVSGDVVLRLPVIGLRLCPEEFFAQLEDALRARGWSGSRLNALA